MPDGVPVADARDGLEWLEAIEDAEDVRHYDEAKAADDGERFTLNDLRADHEALAARDR